MARPLPILTGQEQVGYATADFLRDFQQSQHLTRASGTLYLQLLTVVEMVALKSFSDEEVHYQREREERERTKEREREPKRERTNERENQRERERTNERENQRERERDREREKEQEEEGKTKLEVVIKLSLSH